MAENQEVDEQELARRREALDHYQRHVHELPCATDCSIFGVPNPVDGDKWMLQRFILAQDEEHTYDRALAEMASVKITDWIWFVFPQIWGLATKPTPTSTRYALRRGGEAHAYAAHPVLFSRLVADVLENFPSTIQGVSNKNYGGHKGWQHDVPWQSESE